VKNNLLVWTSHSCRPDVFEQELAAGNLPNYASLVERGTYFPNARVGGHFQRTSNLSEITGRPFTSEVHPRENILNAAAESGAHVGVVNDFIITQGARFLVAKATINSIDEVYPRLIDKPPLPNLGTPKIEFLPDLSPERWLYWYRERATHRHFYNFALAFEEEGGLLVEVAGENPGFVRDQQRYSLRLQDRWFGDTLRHLEQKGVLDDTVIVAFSSHGTSIDSWLPLMKRITRANVDHAGFNFHPNVSGSFIVMAGPGISQGRNETWVSVMDMKPTLCRLLGIPDLGGSTYGVDLLVPGELPGDRLLADVTDEWCYSLFDTSTGWLMMKTPYGEDANRDTVVGLPTSEDGLVAFQTNDDPGCTTVRTDDFLAHPGRSRFGEEIHRLGLRPPARLRGDT